jgi:hypothetical protein
MKKPTKAQRHRIYKGALAQMEWERDKGWRYFVCCAIDTACFAELQDFPERENMEDLFPEFMSCKPKNADYTWWPNTDKGNAARFAAIRKCIRLTTPAPRKKP